MTFFRHFSQALSIALVGFVVGISGANANPAEPATPKALAIKTEHIPTKPAAKAPPKVNTNIPFADVEITASDQLVLYGRLYDPSQKGDDTPDPEDMPKNKYPLVVLMHDLGGSSADWGGLPYYLVKAGYAVFALDVRGHGKSIKTERGKRFTWRAFKPTDWNAVPRDVDRVLRFFQNSEDYPEVNGHKAAIIGAQMGANAALIAGTNINAYAPGSIQAVVLIDASKQFRTLNTADAAISFKQPLFVAASQTNMETFDDSQKIYRWALGAKVLRLYKNAGSGTMLVRNQPDLQQAIAQWLQKHYPVSVPVKAPVKPKK